MNMPEPHELAYKSATPKQIIARLDILRERYRVGFFTAADFNATLKAFQFRDDVGHLWAPGATSNQWYRWDMDHWTAATPPARLNVPQAVVMFDDMPAGPAAPIEPRAVQCPNCGAANV